jgi:cytochrome P450
MGQAERGCRAHLADQPVRGAHDDPDFYDELCSGPSKRRDKWWWSARMFGNSSSMFGTIPHGHHRLRRAPLNPFFSKQSVTRLEPVIRSAIDTLCARLREFQRSKEPVDLRYAFCALSADIITKYCFAVSYDHLLDLDFAPKIWHCLVDMSAFTHL